MPAQGESIVTIDGEVRQLSDETLVIADHEGAVAIAGVMGGLDSEVDDTTTRSFWSRPTSIRPAYAGPLSG